jgi:hypothetical protein
MKRVKWLVIGLLVASLMAALAWSRLRPVGLARAARSAATRDRFRIEYVEDGAPGNLFVYGDGRLVLQKRGSDGSSQDKGLRPTCTGVVDDGEINALIRLMVQRHFERLPQKGFPDYVGTHEAFPWRLHVIIVVDEGTTQGTWVFETGEMNGKAESIPPDFAAVEDYLRKLRSRTIPADGKPCPLAPQVQWQG